MRYEFTVALRYLWAARKKAHMAFLSGISTLGLGVGVATLIISLAMLSGLQGKIKARLIASSPQVLIEPTGSNSIEDAGAVIAKAHEAGAERIESLVTGIAWGSTREGERGRPLRIRSFDPAHPPSADVSFGRTWQIPARPGDQIIFVTRDFASAIGLFLGDEIVVVAPRSRLTPFGPVPVWRKFRIARLVASSNDERAPDAFLPFHEASLLFGTEGRPTSIEIFGESSHAEAIQSALRKAFPNLLVETWKEINRPLFLALRLEKVVMFATISLIIFVAALNLISSLAMLVVEKRPHVGVLRTLGASERSVLVLFLSVGLFIGIAGTIIGNAIGLGVAWSANRFHLVQVPQEIYMISYIPFTIDPLDVLSVNVVAIFLSILATWYPARIASRLDPITAIRDE